MNLFNKYGNIGVCSTLEDQMSRVNRAVEVLLDRAVQEGASIVELRAIESMVIGEVACTMAERRMRIQCEMRKEEREEYERRLVEAVDPSRSIRGGDEVKADTAS